MHNYISVKYISLFVINIDSTITVSLSASTESVLQISKTNPGWGKMLHLPKAKSNTLQWKSINRQHFEAVQSISAMWRTRSEISSSLHFHSPIYSSDLSKVGNPELRPPPDNKTNINFRLQASVAWTGSFLMLDDSVHNYA